MAHATNEQTSGSPQQAPQQHRQIIITRTPSPISIKMSGNLSVNTLSNQGELDTTWTLLHSLLRELDTMKELDKELLSHIKQLEEEREALFSKLHLLQTQNKLAATEKPFIPVTPIKTQSNFAASKTEKQSTPREILHNIKEEKKDLMIENVTKKAQQIEEISHLRGIIDCMGKIETIQNKLLESRKEQKEQLEGRERKNSHLSDIICSIDTIQNKLLESNTEQLEGQRDAKELKDNEVYYNMKLSDYLKYVEQMESVNGGALDSSFEIEDFSGEKINIDIKKMSLVSIFTFSFSSVCSVKFLINPLMFACSRNWSILTS